MNASNRVDPELVKRAQAGDGAAFTQLFEELYRPILNYVYHTVGDQAAAEDITQDAFIRAHDNLGKLGPPWDFKSWVYRIAGNLAIDRLRRSKRFVDFEEQVSMGESPTTRRPAERKLQREDAVHSVHGTLDQMPTGYRQALILRELNGLSYQQMAAAMECSYANARQLVHRARTRFRDLHLARMTLAESAARCPVLGEMLSAYHDDELSMMQRREVEEHIAGCKACQQTRDEFKKVGALVAGLLPILPTPGFETGVLDKLDLKPFLKEAPHAVKDAAGLTKRVPRPEGNKTSGLKEASPPPETPAPPPLGKGGGGGLMESVKGSIFMQIAVGVIAGGIVLAGIAFGAGILGQAPAPQPSPGEASPLPPTSVSEASPTSAGAVIPAAHETDEAGPTLMPSPTTLLEDPPRAEAVMDANCRMGPSDVYEVAGAFLTGTVADIHGRNYTTTWWWIEFPSDGAHCWVWDGSVALSGDTSLVPVIPAPPTAVPPDTTPPSVTVSLSSRSTTTLTTNDIITFMADASDDVGVARIEIWVKSSSMNTFQLAGSCQGMSTCSVQGGPYSSGSLFYYAAASDAAGNRAETIVNTILIY